MIGPDFQYRDKIPVAIIGATGSIGQKFVELLSPHPWFQIKVVIAAEQYGKAAHWQMQTDLFKEIAEMTLQKCHPGFSASVVFSCLDSSVAEKVETELANHGYLVVSSSDCHWREHSVPLLIPEVNYEHLALVETQHFPGGNIVANPHRSVVGLAMALKPLELKFGLEALSVVTIETEKDIKEGSKIEAEILTILGKVDRDKIKYPTFTASVEMGNVAFADGSLLRVSVKLKKTASFEEIIAAWDSFQGSVTEMKLPSAPKRPLHFFREENFSQMKLDRDIERGMAVSLGGLKKCSIFDYEFLLALHDPVRGAAGRAILNAELLTKLGMVYW